MANDFKYEIVKEIKVLSEKNGYTKEINIIKYRDDEPLIDIRKWNKTTDNAVMLKGVTLTKDEFIALKECINDIDF